MKTKNFWIGLILILIISNTWAISQKLESAPESIESLRADLGKMERLGFGVTRITDELFIINQIYENNYNQEMKNLTADNKVLFDKIDDLKTLISSAYSLKDELIALDTSIIALDEEIDTNQARELYNDAEKEFLDERYEFVTIKIDLAYEKLSELQSDSAKTNAAYEATRKNIMGFLNDNWILISILILIPLSLYIIFRRKINRYLLQRKITENENEIHVLKNEIKKSQEKYFIQGKESEDSYQIKADLYGRKIREINKDNALLLEKLERNLHPKKIKKTFVKK
ncbi:MAG: hypothetical protein WC915_05315 [archaeon]|jgi:hypothetical protein